MTQSIFLLGGQTPNTFPSYRQLMEKCAAEGNFLSFDEHSDWLACYAHDAQQVQSRTPLIVFRPHSISNIPPFVAACSQFSIPIAIRCGGTGRAGGAVPAKEGIVLLTGHLKQIREYCPKQGTLFVEPGTTIRQINQLVERDGWHFPLSIAVEGVAGIAGCLSANARAYHRQQQSILEWIDDVTIIDGRGQIQQIAAPLACGAEGLMGVIIEIKVKLAKKSAGHCDFCWSGNWDSIMPKLSTFRSLKALDAIAWFKEKFYLTLSSANWRLRGATAFLKKNLPGIEEMAESCHSVLKHFVPSHPHFAIISASLRPGLLPEACDRSLNIAEHMQLNCMQQADVLNGVLHLILESPGSMPLFNRSLEQFLTLWADYVNGCKGVLAACNGVGTLMNRFMTPFLSEDTLNDLHKIHREYDPQNLFGRERFFPIEGKSLERVLSTPSEKQHR